MKTLQRTQKWHVLIVVAVSALAFSLPTRSLTLAALAFVGFGMVLSARIGGQPEPGPATRRLTDETTTEQAPLPVDLRLEGPRRGSVLLEVREGMPPVADLAEGSNHHTVVLAAKTTWRTPYVVSTPRPGVFRLGPLRLRTEDAFGLTRRTWTAAGTTEYVVRPRIEVVRRSPERSRLPRLLLGRHAVSQPGDGFDFFGLRDYVPGDRIRSVNWKASARTRRFIVNQYDRESLADIVVFLDARAAAEAGVETHTPSAQGARVVASLAARYAKARDALRLVVYGGTVDEAGIPGRRLEMGDVLDALARTEASGDSPLLRAVEEKLPTLRPRSPVVVVSWLAGDPTIEDAAALLLGRRAHLTVVVPHPLVPEGEEADWAPRLAERRLAMAGLQGMGAHVVDLEPDGLVAPRLEEVYA